MIPAEDLGILADDLTGACDVAACFAERAGPITVQVDPDTLTDLATPLRVLNTQSRLLQPEVARRRLQEVAEDMYAREVIFKKTDSVLRGPAGAELEGMAGALSNWRFVVCPAIPALGKTVAEGLLYEQGVLVTETAYAREAASPLASAAIAELLAQTGTVEVSIADASTQRDLERLVDEALDSLPVLLAGSLGLAQALAQQLPHFSLRREPPPGCRPAVIISGSLYPRTKAQLQLADEQTKAARLTLAAETDPTTVAQRIIEEQSALVELQYSSQAQTPQEALEPLLPPLLQVLSQVRPQGLGIIGGETAYHLLRALGVTGLEIRGRMSEVIAYGIALDGPFPGGPVVTKGGSVGPPEAVVQMLHYLMTGEIYE